MFVFLTERTDLDKGTKQLFVYAVCLLHNMIRRFSEYEAVRLDPEYQAMRDNFQTTLREVNAELDARDAEEALIPAARDPDVPTITGAALRDKIRLGLMQ